MLPDRLSRAETLPMGVEFEAFSARWTGPEVIRNRFNPLEAPSFRSPTLRHGIRPRKHGTPLRNG
jgi:hypothetical protein